MKTPLDALLEKIAKEPLAEHRSMAEDLFFFGLESLKKVKREDYIRYVMRYNEIRNSKYDTTNER